MQSGVIFFARLLLAVLFIWGGAMKLVGYAEFTAFLNSLNVPFPTVAAGLVIAVEGLGGLLLLFGYKVRPVALLLALFTVGAAMFGHNFWDATDPQVQHQMVADFWKSFAIAGGFLLLWVTGAGSISVDGLRRSNSSSSFLRPRG